MTVGADDSLAQMLADEAAKARKLEIIFGPWWRHYAVPYEFPATLYVERSTCPYCGGPLGIHALSSLDALAEDQSAHLDHMDPLSRGGEDSIRNAAYVCSGCNLTKGRRLFVDWLGKLNPPNREGARQLCEDKHGHAPEKFQPGAKQPRLTLPRCELSFDEAVLRKLFPRPIVSGPPMRE
ncbi:HNH endonuclease [Sulfuritalea hydrogenivorans sk43H]|jgi:hypothetical protein|uniref:HNH endonuclease n=1 Tax=Sulfuritalea hydrogenivorans sk43H TaxID=1223802 RepID=W0SF92_9PROT|nr:HNH endonuclease [Sulfuritalea hydrogenivorans sk43H]